MKSREQCQKKYHPSRGHAPFLSRPWLTNHGSSQLIMVAALPLPELGLGLDMWHTSGQWHIRKFTRGLLGNFPSLIHEGALFAPAHFILIWDDVLGRHDAWSWGSRVATVRVMAKTLRMEEQKDMQSMGPEWYQKGDVRQCLASISSAQMGLILLRMCRAPCFMHNYNR